MVWEDKELDAQPTWNEGLQQAFDEDIRKLRVQAQNLIDIERIPSAFGKRTLSITPIVLVMILDRLEKAEARNRKVEAENRALHQTLARAEQAAVPKVGDLTAHTLDLLVVIRQLEKDLLAESAE